MKRYGRWDRRFYHPGDAFMKRGGIFGRSRSYPHKFLLIRRVFRTCIRIRYDTADFTHPSENVRAFNSHIMVPMFAYQLRPTSWRAPPRPRKSVVQELRPIEAQIKWRQAA